MLWHHLPCGNKGDAGFGCANSSGGGATLEGNGSNRVSADDAIFTKSGLMPGKPALFFSGVTQVNAGAGTIFGAGLRSLGGQIFRLKVRFLMVWATPLGDPGTHLLRAGKAGTSERFKCGIATRSIRPAACGSTCRTA
ncbi:MAG: hypothetical protein ACI9F9_000691 [Candidatus Paceibacteria bacterium]